ncbi:hypothetical protein [Sphingomonas sp. MA1305]|uniref:hypothetical protein n=1 Tax=Sphingomonas sp. MA1305 TaxID=2479204 RepID=UPI0018DF409D|nr:hypothetical protein [Sphingomonas sp. MA1305]
MPDALRDGCIGAAHAFGLRGAPLCADRRCVAARWRAMFVPVKGRGQTPGARAALLERSIPLCYGAPIT